MMAMFRSMKIRMRMISLYSSINQSINQSVYWEMVAKWLNS